MAWGKAGSTTLSSAGDDIDITSLSESKTRMIMSHVLNSGACQNKVTFNDTGSSKYACRIQYNDDAEDLRVNQNFIPHWDGNDNASNDQFVVSYLCDVEGEEKLGMYWSIDRGTAGAGNTIRTREMAYKFIDTPKITRFDLNNQGSGDYGADSNVTILGSELTPAAAVPAISNIQDNSLFVEKENARRYWFVPNTITLQSDFSSSTGWTTNSSSLLNVDTSAQEIDFTFNVDNGDIGTMYYDLTSTSDTKWLLRSQVDIDTISQGSDTNDKWLFYGLSSTNNGANETQDFLGMAIRVDNTKTELFAIETDGSAPNNESTTVFTRNAQAETLYVEMKRESATSFTVSLYSDSSYSTLLESKTITASSGTATLRYLKLSGLQGFSDSQIVGSIPNITFYNSATEPTTWTMQPTYQDDFSTDKGWVSSGVQAKIDSNGYLLYDEDSDGNPHKIYYDIGRTLDDTKWLWRFKITTNTFTMNTDPTPQIVYIRISDNTDHRGGSNNEDAIGFSYRTSDGNQKYIRTTYSDGAIFGTTSNFSTQIATGTHYVQITRDSSTQFTVKLYSDSSYSTLVESKSITIPSTITSLRYLKIDNIDSDGTSNGRLIFHIDDMELYSGVTSEN